MTNYNKEKRISQIRADLAWKRDRLIDAQEHSIIVRLEDDIKALQLELSEMTAPHRPASVGLMR